MLTDAHSRHRIVPVPLVIFLLASSSKGARDTVDDDGDCSTGPPSGVGDLAFTSVNPITVGLRWSAPHGGNPITIEAVRSSCDADLEHERPGILPGPLSGLGREESAGRGAG
jgi:hypothetical protein